MKTRKNGGSTHTHTKTWLVCLIKNHFVLNVYHYTHQIGRRLKVLYGSPVVYILHSTDYCKERERESISSRKLLRLARIHSSSSFITSSSSSSSSNSCRASFNNLASFFSRSSFASGSISSN